MSDIKCGCCEPGCAQCGTDLNLARLSPHGYRTAKTDPEPIPLPCPHTDRYTYRSFVRMYGFKMVERCRDCDAILAEEWCDK